MKLSLFPYDPNRPTAALDAHSICNEYAAVIKQITRQRNTRLRVSQYLQISGNIALMLPYSYGASP
jgi:hypothetical protein